MKQVLRRFLSFVRGNISDEIKTYIARENMHVVSMVSLVVFLLESYLLVVSSIFLRNKPEDLKINVISLAYCVVVSLGALLLCRLYYCLKITNLWFPAAVIVSYYVLLSLWGMQVSFRNYRMGAQMLTFFIVVFCFACFTVLPPLASVLLFGVSSSYFHYVIVQYDGGDRLNPMNYFALMLMIVVASWIRYYGSVRSYEKTIETERLNARLSEMTRTDSLTGLKNRLALEQDEPGYENRELIVMMADIDHFKGFNDQYGHAAGDEVLTVFSRYLTGQFGTEHVYRLGGDEFLVILPALCEPQFRACIDSWEVGLSTLSIPDLPDLKIGGSGGYVYGRIASLEDLKDLIRHADKALYAAKENGRNRVFGAAG